MRKTFTAAAAAAAFLAIPNTAAHAATISEMCLTMSSPIVDPATLAELCGPLTGSTTTTAPTSSTPTLTSPTLTSPTLTSPTLTSPTLTSPTLTQPTLQAPSLQSPTLAMPTLPPLSMPALPAAQLPALPQIVAPAVAAPVVAAPAVASAQPSGQGGGLQSPQSQLDQLNASVNAGQPAPVEMPAPSKALSDGPLRTVGIGFGGLLLGAAAMTLLRRRPDYAYDDVDDAEPATGNA